MRSLKQSQQKAMLPVGLCSVCSHCVDSFHSRPLAGHRSGQLIIVELQRLQAAELAPGWRQGTAELVVGQAPVTTYEFLHILHTIVAHDAAIEFDWHECC